MISSCQPVCGHQDDRFDCGRIFARSDETCREPTDWRKKELDTQNSIGYFAATIQQKRIG